MKCLSLAVLLLGVLLSFGLRADSAPLYTYTLERDGTPAAYDEAMAVATLQGVINRGGPELYVLSRKNDRPRYWLDVLSKGGRWLEGRPVTPVADLTGLVKLAGPRVKGAVIWDPAVPATVDVATTVAGVEDAVVLSPELADRYLAEWRLPVVKDLRGMFTGAETGSAKNDAYRWAIRNYFAAGKCSSKLLCLFDDAYVTRAKGDVGYVVTRDWAVRNRAFVFDLSPWGDEPPQDEPKQEPGVDLETYKAILEETKKLAAGEHMTELTGFFAQTKYAVAPGHASKHEGVPTEWESVWLMTPYNVYQNTISSDCYNQSLHSQFPRKPLHQKSGATQPVTEVKPKAYVCILMADYDSATPLYDTLPKNWYDAGRGKTPMAWGVNPNLLDTYPDLIAYYYETATPNDTFTSDASCAGYVNPNRLRPESLPLFVAHNEKYFREADMTVAPMVLDQDQPTAAVKDAFAKFAAGGMAVHVEDMHGQGGHAPAPQVWKGMPVIEMLNDACNAGGRVDETAEILARAIVGRGNPKPGFYLFRVVWVKPSSVNDAIATLRRKHPELDVDVVGPREFFALFKASREGARK